MGRKRKHSQSKQERELLEERIAFEKGLKDRTIIRVDSSKIFSKSVLPKVPEYYRDELITCKDCGGQELWTAKSQQGYYEVFKGEIENKAIRCSACRKQRRHQNKEFDQAREKAAEERKDRNKAC